MAKRRDGALTRKRIVQAAVVLFSDRGFDGISLRDVADASGSPLSTLAHHFGSRKALEDAALTHAVEVVSGRLDAIVAPVCDDHEALTLWIAGLTRMFMSGMPEMRLLDRELWSKPEQTSAAGIAAIRYSSSGAVMKARLERLMPRDLASISPQRFRDILSSLCYGLSKLTPIQALDTPAEELTPEGIATVVTTLAEKALGGSSPGIHDTSEFSRIGRALTSFADVKELLALRCASLMQVDTSVAVDLMKRLGVRRLGEILAAKVEQQKAAVTRKDVFDQLGVLADAIDRHLDGREQPRSLSRIVASRNFDRSTSEHDAIGSDLQTVASILILDLARDDAHVIAMDDYLRDALRDWRYVRDFHHHILQA